MQLAEAAPKVDVRMVKCGACGSETEPPEHLDAFDCAFCGTNMVASESSSRKPSAEPIKNAPVGSISVVEIIRSLFSKIRAYYW